MGLGGRAPVPLYGSAPDIVRLLTRLVGPYIHVYDSFRPAADIIVLIVHQDAVNKFVLHTYTMGCQCQRRQLSRNSCSRVPYLLLAFNTISEVIEYRTHKVV